MIIEESLEAAKVIEEISGPDTIHTVLIGEATMRASRHWRCSTLAAMGIAAMLGLPRIRVSADEPKAAGVATFRTAIVTRGDLVTTVGATGTIEPEQVVDIGSQVCGMITDLSVDYGSQVEQGTILAKIDDTLYVAQVEQARIGCQRADAELAMARAKLSLAKVDWQRVQELIKTKAIATTDFDVAKYTYEAAQAAVAVAVANSAQSELALKQAKIHLDWTSIRSPFKGVIIDRRVNVGQTVVSNPSAANLFLIAKDLKKLQVWASVNEADIGRIHEGMQVRFKVDAYPNENFVGKVAQIRLNATMTQNVVTYTVVVTTENKEMKLLPYMTASLVFEIERHENVLKVPNAALRWKPRPMQIAASVREENLAAMNRPKQDESGHLWIADANFVRPVPVKIIATDGTMTEVKGKYVSEGMEVVIGESIASDADSGDATNPFMPKLFRPSRNKSKDAGGSTPK